MKYVPAALWGLLVVAWVASLFCQFYYVHNSPEDEFGVSNDSYWVMFGLGNVVLRHNYHSDPAGLHCVWMPLEVIPKILKNQWAGGIGYNTQPRVQSNLQIPIPLALTVFLPVAVGCLNRFRFSLWSYFACTALVAA